MASSTKGDSKYFTTTKKGEIHELREELESPKEEKNKEAIKKVIAAMTVGKDVKFLFPNVVKCLKTQNLEIKKLVYLYIMNYAKSQPDIALLTVSSFVTDATSSPNPLIKALAIRTMGCIRVERISEYLCQPLGKALKDPDPYVRKTAAICVAKLYDISPELVTDQGFLDGLLELLGDSNPMVVANAVAALSEIDELSDQPVFTIDRHNLQRLLNAHTECTEWGQVFILNALASYVPRDARDAEKIAERVSPRLQHANSAVVLGAVKVLMKLMDYIQSKEVIRQICTKMAPPLVTLLSKEPEIQYVALRNINLIVQKRPSILQYKMKYFFCKFNDPIYVKMEKLQIMIMLASEKTIEQVLLEFKEYATEVDVEFVRKSVRAIGRCAIKLERAAERCIQVLLGLIQTKVNYVVQEAVIVIKDIFRKYPNQYEGIIATLCENLKTLDEPEAKASMIWIIGEYAERIENADELLESFLESFQDENPLVQLQLLTATVKLFLKRPKDTQALVQIALNMATQESDNPDLRDRGFVYWRLLSTDPEAAKAVVLAEKPLITDASAKLDPTLLDELLGHISSLASVYHKPPETFVSKMRVPAFKAKPSPSAAPQAASPVTQRAAPVPAQPAPTPAPAGDLLDLSDLGSNLPASTPQPPASGGSLLDDLSGLGSPAPAPTASTHPVLLPFEKGKGMQIRGQFSKREGNLFLDLTFENQTSVPLSGLAIQFNKNTFGLTPASPLSVPAIMPGQQASTSLPIATTGPVNPAQDSTAIQMAVKNNIDIFYFQHFLPLHLTYAADGKLEKANYLQLWKSIPDTNEFSSTIANLATANVEEVSRRLEAHNLFFIARRKVNDMDVLYLSAKTLNGKVFLGELTFLPGGQCKSCVRTEAVSLVQAYSQSIEALMS